MAINLINAENITKTFGTRTLIDSVSLGLAAGDVIGVVGRNGDGKTTLLKMLTGQLAPDSGRVTRTGSVSVGFLNQTDSYAAEATVRDVIVHGEPDHVWASDAMARSIVSHLLAEIDLDAVVARLSGGERRRTALVALMLSGHDLIVLDEPTNHLDVEAVSWLATHLNALQAKGTAMAVVSHDRWFLDEVCNHIWEIHDGTVDAYEGGYAAYVLARAERARQASANESRRQNLARKELAWLRRGAPARTSKPKFRIEAAETLIADVPPPRDRLQLERFATQRLGKDVFDLHSVGVSVPGSPDPGTDAPPRVLLRDLTWSIGPGQRIGLVGVNGAGKTTLLNLLDKRIEPDRGTVKQGRTLDIGHLSQTVEELDGADRVLDATNRIRERTVTASGREASTSSLLEDFGFTGDRLVTRVSELSGGERRRLQFLRLLLSEPNVLLLDEPTNDLDIDTLTVVEDYLDSWPGTLVVVSHDRYFLERVCDVTYAMMGDGTCVLLPGGVDQYLEARAARPAVTADRKSRPGDSAGSAAQQRQAKKEISKIESQLKKVDRREAEVHEQMISAASDYARLGELQRELDELIERRDGLELSWLELSEDLES